MPENKSALKRYRIINDEIRNNPDYCTLSDIVEKINVMYSNHDENKIISESMVRKDMRAIEEIYNVEIKYNFHTKGYCYTSNHYNINFPTLTNNDIETIDQSLIFLEQLATNSTLKPHLRRLEQVMTRMKYGKSNRDQFIFFESNPPIFGKDNFDRLVEAIQNNQVISFYYKSYSHEEKFNYKIHPYGLKEYKSRWYLIGMNNYNKTIRFFAIERIYNFEKETSIEYQYKPGFNLKEYHKYSMGITVPNENPVELTLEIGQDLIKYFKVQEFHPTQEIIHEDEHKMIIKVKVYITMELFQELLRHCDNIIVLEPKKVKEKLKEKLKIALNKYK